MDKETQREYNKTSYEKRKQEGQKVCSICFGTYTYYNKSHHNKTERHLRALNAKTLILDEALNNNNHWTHLEMEEKCDNGSDTDSTESI